MALICKSSLVATLIWAVAVYQSYGEGIVSTVVSDLLVSKPYTML